MKTKRNGVEILDHFNAIYELMYRCNIYLLDIGIVHCCVIYCAWYFCYLFPGLFVYTTGNTIIIEDLNNSSQKHLSGHVEEISTLALQNDCQVFVLSFLPTQV